jgi:hypothetical protein
VQLDPVSPVSVEPPPPEPPQPASVRAAVAIAASDRQRGDPHRLKMFMNRLLGDGVQRPKRSVTGPVDGNAEMSPVGDDFVIDLLVIRAITVRMPRVRGMLRPIKRLRR